jgi:predicted enzyme related to lactoylglutathione lyase
VATRLVHLVLDSADPSRAATFWAEALGWKATVDRQQVAFAAPADFDYPGTTAVPLVFVPVPGPKTAKNRMHLDVAPFADDDLAMEAARLQTAGAKPAEIGQGAASWIVLADPDGQEFCVLTPR